MTVIYNKHKQLEIRRYLRKNSTVPEKLLWLKIKNKQLGAKFRRQYGIGHYVADFCSPRQKLVVELDGGIHNIKEERYYDEERQKTIEELGFKVLRFDNEDVEKRISAVIGAIKKHIK